MDAYAWLAAQQAEMTANLMELANQNSGSDNLQGLLRVADWLEDRMDLRQAHFQRIPLPPRHIIDHEGKELAIETGPALRWDFQPEQPRRVLLAIHYDTVFGGDDAFQTCELLNPDRLQGPGVADAKGGILVIRYALHALRKYSLANAIGWTVLLNPDEEVGSPSSRELLRQMAPEFDFGLLFEPAMPSGALVSERKGSGNFSLVVRGQSAHAGRHFDEGRNAVVELCRLMAALDTLNGTLPGITINVGHVRGGGASNVVPDLAVGKLNIRVADMATAAWFEQQLARHVAALNAKEGFQCRSFGDLASPPKPLSAELHQLMRAVEDATVTVGGGTIEWKSTGGVCDGNKLAAAGLPNIDTLGPIGFDLHGRTESVQLSSLVQKAQVVVNLVSRFSTGEFSALQRQRFDPNPVEGN